MSLIYIPVFVSVPIVVWSTVIAKEEVAVTVAAILCGQDLPPILPGQVFARSMFLQISLQ